jgi:hypothetical protein
MRTPPIGISSTKTEDNHTGLNSHLYLTPNGLDRLSRIFTVVKHEISIITGSFSPMLDRLEAETVTKARVYLEDSAVERGASSKTEVLMINAVRPAPYRSSAFTESVSCSI